MPYKTKKICLILGLLSMLISLSTFAVTFADESSFSSRNKGWVAKTDTLALLECVTDGFHNIKFSAWVMHHFAFQERRVLGYRVELRGVEGDLLIRADVRDDGFVEVSVPSDTSGSHFSHIKDGLTSFDTCLKKYAISKTPN